MKSIKEINFCFYALIFCLFASCHKDEDESPAPVTPPATQTVTLACSSIITETTLSDVNSTPGEADYIVPCTISVEAKLTVNPGVIIQFANDAGLSINNLGSLTAIGSDTMPIIFRGSTSLAGSWKGIYFLSNNVLNNLSFVTITGGGSNSFNGANVKSNIRVGSLAQLRISDCTIDNSAVDGLYSDGLSTNVENPLMLFSNNHFTNNINYPVSVCSPSAGAIDSASTYVNNGKQKIEVRAGCITATDVWKNCHVPFYLNGTTSVGANANPNGYLTIDPGTTLIFSAGSALSMASYGNGYIRIVGTTSNRITLTGDTSIAGSWAGIAIKSLNVQNEISYADISYAGCCSFDGNTTHKGNIVVGSNSDGMLNISNTSIVGSASCGIKINGSSTCVPGTGMTYSNNSGGNICN